MECQTQWFMPYHDFVWNAVTVFLAIPRNQLSNLISVFLGGNNASGFKFSDIACFDIQLTGEHFMHKLLCFACKNSILYFCLVVIYLVRIFSWEKVVWQIHRRQGFVAVQSRKQATNQCILCIKLLFYKKENSYQNVSFKK